MVADLAAIRSHHTGDHRMKYVSFLSQLETNVIVERKTLPSGKWDPYATLDANQTSYVDPNANRGVSYAYRVYEIEDAGPLVSSNEADVQGH
jgi:hypothetical protein